MRGDINTFEGCQVLVEWDHRTRPLRIAAKQPLMFGLSYDLGPWEFEIDDADRLALGAEAYGSLKTYLEEKSGRRCQEFSRAEWN